MIHTIRSHGFTYEVARFSDGALAVRRLSVDPCDRAAWTFDSLSEANDGMGFDVAAELLQRPVAIVVGPAPRKPGEPQPRSFSSWKELCETYGWHYGPDRRAEDENRERVLMIPVGGGDAASRLPCPCARCGKVATLMTAFENRGGTEIYCGYDCYRAAGGEA